MKKLVISDIHANPEALEAVLAASKGEYEGILCLGDITGYGPDPEACIRILRSLQNTVESCVMLSGNHDAVLFGAIPLDWFNKQAQASILRMKRTLSPDSLEWLSFLPSYVDLGKRALAVHGAPEEPVTGYLFGGMETQSALSYMDAHSFDVCFCGHTHSAAVFTGGRKVGSRSPASGESVSLTDAPVIVNPGSTGFPRTFNGTGQGANGVLPPGGPISPGSYPAYFAIWDTAARTVDFREARYDRTPVEEKLSRLK